MGHSLSLPSQTVLENGLLVDVERLELFSVEQVLWCIFQELIVFDTRFDRYDFRVCQILVRIVETALEAKQLPIKIGQVVLFVRVRTKVPLKLLAILMIIDLLIINGCLEALVRLPRRLPFIQRGICAGGIVLIATAQIGVLLEASTAVVEVPTVLLLLLAGGR